MRAIVPINAHGQTTIPPDIRAALRLKVGDSITWEIREEGTAIVRGLVPMDSAYMHAVGETLTEWLSPEDEEAYRDL